LSRSSIFFYNISDFLLFNFNVGNLGIGAPPGPKSFLYLSPTALLALFMLSFGLPPYKVEGSSSSHPLSFIRPLIPCFEVLSMS